MPFEFGSFAAPFGYTDDAAGIAKAQADWGLPATGELDAVTVNVLTRIPRCGCSDAQPVAGQMDRWGIPVVSYFIAGYPVGLGLSSAQVDAVVAASFASWSAVCGLKFSKAPDAQRCNIRMDVGRGRRANFDGPGGTLAWCEIPQGSSFRGQINLCWDMEEPFTTDPNANGILFLNTTAHEIGHGCGLYHNSQPQQLMNPVYNRRISTPQSYEIGEMVARYGKPSAVVPSTPTTPVTATDPVAVKVQCRDGSVWGGQLTRL